MFELLGKIPYNLFVVIFMILAHFLGLPMSMMGFGTVFFIAYAMALIVEFVKSATTNPTIFTVDLVFSVISLVTMTAFMTYVMVKEGGNANAVYWFGAFSVFVDAVLSPRNSFKALIARRTMNVEGGTH